VAFDQPLLESLEAAPFSVGKPRRAESPVEVLPRAPVFLRRSLLVPAGFNPEPDARLDVQA
jgi:hypothetical protein